VTLAVDEDEDEVDEEVVVEGVEAEWVAEEVDDVLLVFVEVGLGKISDITGINCLSWSSLKA